MRRPTASDQLILPWVLHPAWGIYAAALTLALTTRDEDERHAAACLVRDLAEEQLEPVRARPDRSARRESFGMLGDLIRETLADRLRTEA